MSSQKLKHLLFAVLLFCFGLFLSEGLLRLLGIGPHHLQIPLIESTPEASLRPHSQLGLSLNPGKYQVTINQGLTYQCQHLADSTRSTGFSEADSLSRKKVFLFGCSFTYGMGVSDSLTFPFLLQKQFPEWKIYNYGVPAYGTLQAYLQLQNQLAQGNHPDLVVLNYAALHDGRNKLSVAQQKYWREAFGVDTGDFPDSYQKARFPCVRQVPTGDLNIQYLSLPEMEKRWHWSHFSALVKLTEVVVDNIRDGFADKSLISQKIIAQILATCRENYIPFLLTGITNEKETQEMLGFWEKRNIPVLNFALDLQNSQYNLQPYDSHPNAAAHQIMAQKLGTFLQNQKQKLNLN